MLLDFSANDAAIFTSASMFVVLLLRARFNSFELPSAVNEPVIEKVRVPYRRLVATCHDFFQSKRSSSCFEYCASTQRRLIFRLSPDTLKGEMLMIRADIFRSDTFSSFRS